MTSPTQGQERETKNRTVGGTVTPAEEVEVLAAFDQAGMPNKSRATRAVLLAFSRSTRVRDAVASFLRENLDVLAA